MSPEAICQRCGGPNVTWFAPNELWNRVDPKDGILCPVCFVQLAEEAGIRPTGWCLTLEAVDLAAENARLREALESAIETIRTWHGYQFVGRSKDDPNRDLEKKAWEIYRTNAPEMKRLYAALARPFATTKAPGASPLATDPSVQTKRKPHDPSGL